MKFLFIKFSLVSILVLGIMISRAQKIVVKNDTTSIEVDSSVLLVLPEYRGQGYWQQSFDNKNWITLNLLNKDSLSVSTSFDAFYRAKIVDGNCMPIFSDTAAIIMPDSLKREFTSFNHEYAFPDSTNYIEIIWGDDTIVCREVDGKYFFQGDIVLTEEQIKKITGTKGATYPLNSFSTWPQNTVYYTIENNFPKIYRIKDAFSHIESKTNIKFIERTNEPYYTIFQSNKNVSFSSLGMLETEPGTVNIWVGHEAGTVIHEIGHTLGLLHEHSREDRGKHIIVNDFNLPHETQEDIDYIKTNYDIIKHSNMITEFDLNSIMMYPPENGMALDPKIPIIMKIDSSLYKANREYLTKKDAQTINTIYKPIDPQIATLFVTDITRNEAKTGVNVVFDGRPSIEECGVCWSDKGIPTKNDEHDFLGLGIGKLPVTLTNLKPDTKYYVRAYAESREGIFYGNLLTFNTAPPVPPSVTTLEVGSITKSTAIGGGIVTDDGGAPILARGVCWDTSEYPSTSNEKTIDGTGIGTFKSTLLGLKSNTTYYVRAYATNSKGTSYGNQVTFKTSPGYETGSVVDVEGNNYKTVKIGDQWWMAENLKTTKYNDGTSIPNVTSDGTWALMASGAYCWYNNDIANKSIYGALYNWHTANTQKLCPEGWHVPSDSEWTTLATALGGRDTAGGKLKEDGTAHWRSPNDGATNESGFTALPGGYRRNNGPFGYETHYGTLGTGGHWWSATEVGPDSPDSWGDFMYYDNSTFPNYGHSKTAGFSVRCVMDDPTSLPDLSISSPVSGTIQAGASQQIQVTVNKTGGVLGNGSFVEAHLYLSKTSTLGSDKVQLWVSNNSTPDFSNTVLNSNGSKTVVATVTIPSNTVTGNYFIIAVVDEVNYHPETNNNNNTHSNPITVNASTLNPTGTFTDARDNKTYQWVKIGDQTWMAENLAYLPSVSPISEYSEIDKHYYVYDYNGTTVQTAKASPNYSNFGVLYNWPAAMAGSRSNNSNPSTVQGVCPSGWHLPSEIEWEQLENYLIANGYNYDGSTTENKFAKSLADVNFWADSSEPGAIGNDKISNNMSGFTARPGGVFMSDDQIFFGLNEFGVWWSSTEYRTSSVWSKLLQNVYYGMEEEPFGNSNGISVRCIQGSPSELPDLSITTQFTGDFKTSTSKQIQVTVTKSAGILSIGEYVGAHLYLSKTTTLGPDKILLWKGFTESDYQADTYDFLNSELNANGSKTVTATVYIPTNTLQGNYYLIAVVDEVNYHPELDENNNQKATLTNVSAHIANQTGTFTDSRDARTYKWVTIGNQTWMAENLAYLPSVSPASQGSAQMPYYYVIDYEGGDVNAAKTTENYNSFGALYNYPAALQACPSGWHLPSNDEWLQLEGYLIQNGYNFDGTINENKIAKSMAANTHWLEDNSVGTPGNYLAANNKSGFSALPGGGRSVGGVFNYSPGSNGRWWTSTEYDNYYIRVRDISAHYPFLYPIYNDRASGSSVRCIQDSPQALPDLSISSPVSGTILAGASQQIQVTVNKNGGALVNGSYVEAHLYLSKTSALGSDKVQLWVSNNSIPDFPNSVLNSNGSKTVVATVTIPANTLAGNYYIIAVVDEVNYHAEADNNNNTHSNAITVISSTSNLTGSFTDTRDNKTYQWVKIGDQTWMAENLAFDAGSGSCAYDNNEELISIYGRLYTWATALSVCPTGWHLPSATEWTILSTYLADNGYNYDKSIGGGDSKIAKSIAAKTNWSLSTVIGSIGNDLTLNNTSYFSALPGGMWDDGNKFFNGLGKGAGWFSSTEYRLLTAFSRHITSDNVGMWQAYADKTSKLSIRCIKD